MALSISSDTTPILANFDGDSSTPGQQEFAIQTGTFDEITGRVVVDWKPELSFTEDTLVYASYTRGYNA
jgi:iron complex outermembrane receptor protein